MLRNINKPIALNGATCLITEDSVQISGKHGKSSVPRASFIDLKVENDSLFIGSSGILDKDQRSMLGSTKAILISSIKGVQEKHSKVVIFTGTGSSVKVGSDSDESGSFSCLNMRLGKSHPVNKRIPDGLTCVVESADIRETRLKISGIDAALVGQFAAELCIKNPYKGGIHAWVEGKEIPLKEGKSG